MCCALAAHQWRAAQPAESIFLTDGFGNTTRKGNLY